MLSKHRKWIVALIIVLIFGGLWITYTQIRPSWASYLIPVYHPVATVGSTVSIEMIIPFWKTYSDQKIGYSLHYPESWKIVSDSANSVIRIARILA